MRENGAAVQGLAQWYSFLAVQISAVAPVSAKLDSVLLVRVSKKVMSAPLQGKTEF